MQDEEDLESSVAGPTDTLAPPPSASPRRRHDRVSHLHFISAMFVCGR